MVSIVSTDASATPRKVVRSRSTREAQPSRVCETNLHRRLASAYRPIPAGRSRTVASPETRNERPSDETVHCFNPEPAVPRQDPGSCLPHELARGGIPGAEARGSTMVSSVAHPRRHAGRALWRRGTPARAEGRDEPARLRRPRALVRASSRKRGERCRCPTRGPGRETESGACWSSAWARAWRRVERRLDVSRSLGRWDSFACAIRFGIRGWPMPRTEVHLVREIRTRGWTGGLL